MKKKLVAIVVAGAFLVTLLATTQVPVALAHKQNCADSYKVDLDVDVDSAPFSDVDSTPFSIIAHTKGNGAVEACVTTSGITLDLVGIRALSTDDQFKTDGTHENVFCEIGPQKLEDEFWTNIKFSADKMGVFMRFNIVFECGEGKEKAVDNYLMVISVEDADNDGGTFYTDSDASIFLLHNGQEGKGKSGDSHTREFLFDGTGSIEVSVTLLEP